MNIFKSLLIIILIFVNTLSIISQHTQENIDYINKKELELTDDKSYWDNDFVFL